MSNIDPLTVQHFGEEWSAYDQGDLPPEELQAYFDAYFEIFPWSSLPENARGFDMGCGSGRWAHLVAPRVGQLHCIDPSDAALDVAKKRLADQANCSFENAGSDSTDEPPASMDFGYSLGVLHHIPDTQDAIADCARLLKPGAPLLLYLYYAFDNKPAWFQTLWKVSDRVRKVVSALPARPKRVVTKAIALTVYYPFARAGRLLDKAGRDVPTWPLWIYRDASFYTMQTDALDRFGTPLEQRFTRKEIAKMMENAGMKDIKFRDGLPYWCAVGTKA